jgi:hypothetical protein
MEWIGSLAATFVLFVLVVPAVVAVGSVILLGAAGWAFYASPSVARAGFYCPFSKRWVTATFLTQAGSEEPSDVVSCSRFGRDGAVTCKKGCTHMAETGWAASYMEPRFALLSGDVAYRPVAATGK